MGWFKKLESGFVIGTDPAAWAQDVYQKRNDAFQNILDSLTTNGIESRDDIVNPTDILKDFSFGNSASERKKYEEWLAALTEIQKQQEASYQEWYNSPLQQAIRDKQAGLNPDILGLSGSPSSSPNVGPDSPLVNVPSNADRFSAITSGIISLVSSVANVASLPANFANLKLVKSQSQAQELQNLSNFESLVGSEISSRLSDAISKALESGSSFDIPSWFADENNTSGIFDSYAPDDNPRYRSAFQNVRKRMQQNLGNAYEQGKVTSENRSSFAAMAADPTYSSDLIIQIAQLRPYMEARRDLEIAKNKYEESLAKWQKQYQDALDVRSAVDAANEQNDNTAEYYRNIDAEKLAIYDTYIKEAQSISSRMQKAIDNNFLTIYEQNHDNIKGISAAYLYSGGASKSWAEYFGSYMLTELQDPNNLPTLYDANGVPHVNKNGTYVPLGAPSDYDERVSLGSFK